ncbi:MAG: 3-phosphoshikimate 1-carboxyvinyltransferase [Planctomycetes bacterium]|nr:3-phosphoshikimate 1-carboxyvinyltransferase [Planctomycetota bacterium]
MAERLVPQLAWPLDATLTLPGSKSAANRLLVLAALATASGAPVVVSGATPSDDVQHLVAGLEAFGFDVHWTASDTLTLAPRGPNPPRSGHLHCGNAGTALRFLTALAALLPGTWTLDGEAALRRRPIGPLAHALRELGAEVEDTAGCPPVRVRGGTLQGSRCTLDASASGQFASALLLVGSQLPHGLELQFAGPVASYDYVAWTAALLRERGLRIELTPSHARLHPGTPSGGSYAVEGDWSAFGTFACLSFLTGSRLSGRNLPQPSQQADARLGPLLAQLAGSGPRTLDVSSQPDQFLNLAAVAALRPGTTTFTGGANLRHKESDRIAAMATGLHALGGSAQARPDGLVVHGGQPLHGGHIDPQADHRVAMAFALLGLFVPGVHIAAPECVAKSYPGFWDDLEWLLTQRRCIAVVGMRGAGKSTFARAFAAATDTVCVDLDAQFVQAHGPIAPYVAAHGWPAFRDQESALLAAALQPGAVVATGGGAIERAANRRLLAERALVVWLDGDVGLLRARLVGDTVRPSLTGAPVGEEVAAVLAQRQPLYTAAATVRIPAALPTAEQVALARRCLGAPCQMFGKHKPGN